MIHDNLFEHYPQLVAETNKIFGRIKNSNKINHTSQLPYIDQYLKALNIADNEKYFLMNFINDLEDLFFFIVDAIDLVEFILWEIPFSI